LERIKIRGEALATIGINYFKDGDLEVFWGMILVSIVGNLIGVRCLRLPKREPLQSTFSFKLAI